MSAVDDIRRAQRETFEGMDVGPPVWVEDLLGEAIAGFGDAAQAMARYTEATRAATQAFQEYRLAVKRERYRSLFGHPLARVMIVGDRLLVMHPDGGAA